MKSKNFVDVINGSSLSSSAVAPSLPSLHVDCRTECSSDISDGCKKMFRILRAARVNKGDARETEPPPLSWEEEEEERESVRGYCCALSHPILLL